MTTDDLDRIAGELEAIRAERYVPESRIWALIDELRSKEEFNKADQNSDAAAMWARCANIVEQLLKVKPERP